MSIFEKLTKKSQEALTEASEVADRSQSPKIEPEHLVLALIRQEKGTVPRLIEKIGQDPESKAKAIEERIRKMPKWSAPQTEQPLASGSLMSLIRLAEKESRSLGDEYISTEHIFLALLRTTEKDFKELKILLGMDAEKVMASLAEIRGQQKVTTDNPEEKYEVLAKYTRDLTALATEGKLDPVVGRDEEIRRVIQVIARRTKNNPVLIGEPGVGKTAIAEGLANRIVKDDVPEALLHKKLLSLDMGQLIAGAKYRGEFEDRLKGVISEVAKSDGQIILFIDEIHTLVGAGKSEGAMDAGQLLKPALARGELRCIGATTLDEYKKYIEKDAALERRFQTVMVNEPSIEDGITILRGLKEKYEVHHGVRITDAAIIAAVKLSHRYIPSRFLPDKAIDLMDEAASKLSIQIGSVPEEVDTIERKIMRLRVEREALLREKDSSGRIPDIDQELSAMKRTAKDLREKWAAERGGLDAARKMKEQLESLRLESEKVERQGDLARAAELRYGLIPDLENKLKKLEARPTRTDDNQLLREEVGPEEIADVVSKWTGIPVTKMLESESLRLLKMEEVLGRKVLGQDEALRAVSDAVRRARSELSDPNRPIGSFLFLGPTGVGKTETVKALTEFLFNDPKSVVRIDMGEYMEKHSVARLIGAPPGYVGYDEGGQLTETVKRKPYSVILLDEIEKAHPDVFNVLLQVLDEGRLTDGHGKTIDFKNTVIVMTSNLGSHLLLDVSLSEGQKRKEIQSLLTKVFKPEFLNRIDEIVYFNPLKLEQMNGIVLLQLGDVRLRLLEKKITLHVDDSALGYLAKKGFDPVYGARPLRRLIQTEVLNNVSRMLIGNEVSAGDRIELSYHPGKKAKGGAVVQMTKESHEDNLFDQQNLVWNVVRESAIPCG